MAKTNIANERRGMTRRTLLIIGTLTAAIVAFVLFSTYGVITRIQMTAEGSALETEINELRRTEDSLRTVIKTLEHDTIAIERLARERYGYVRSGEQVFIIEKDEE